MPGVVQCEIIAQASCVLFAEKMQGKTAYYAGIDKVRFRRMVRPGDTLSVVRRISDRALVKKDGVTGWYFGRLAH